jgi:sec-independent protein translocase protein TatA
MFDIGLQELVLIFVIALLVFGPKNLPQLGRSLGRAMREFRRASDEFRNTIETNLQMNEPDPPPDVAAATTPETVEATDSPLAQAEALPDSVLDPHAPVESGPGEPPPGEPYLAQRGSRIFHGRDCSWARRIAEPERVYFKRVSDAREGGFLACPSCEPWEPA